MAPSLRRTAARFSFPAAVVLLYLYTFPYFEGIRSANELPRIYLTMSMVERHAFHITDYLFIYQNTPDLSLHKGEYYSNKAPGISFFAIPGFVILKALGGEQDLERLFFWLRLFGSTIPQLFFLLLLWRLLGQIVVSTAVRRLVFLAYAFGTMAFAYGTVLVAHQLSAALIASSFFMIWLYHRGRWSARGLFWAGMSAGGAVFVDYQAAFVGLPLFVYLLVRARPLLRSTALFGLGALVPFSLLGFYHWACFGSPFTTGYQHLAHPVFAEWTSQGFLGLDAPLWWRFVKLHLSPDDGLFYYAPFLLLAFPGLLAMARRRHLWPEAIFSAVIISFFLYFAAALVLQSGWDVGPRYVIVALPFYMVPVAFLVDEAARHWKWLVLPAGLMVVSVVIYAWVAAVFPHFPRNFSDPFFDVTVRLSFAHYLPYNLGWKVGLRGLCSLLPYAALVVGLLLSALWCAAKERRQKLALILGSLLVCAVVLGGYRELLRYRTSPVPYKFLPWMAHMWEPKNSFMNPAALRRQIGPADRWLRRQ